ncbi:hypothetical protein TNIN_68431 [Trichonephila inaurata madagascariensis]|uniref:Uncharacterized protein n=1 Tax=Trichonephila inaurata madagascariensis TaxID=2747483 RepID=A0A8X7C160_9ARAC|nr:hypothetical protein TNIN_68431 [Trichonephila inaurata madagascariensis]
MDGADVKIFVNVPPGAIMRGVQDHSECSLLDDFTLTSVEEGKGRSERKFLGNSGPLKTGQIWRHRQRTGKFPPLVWSGSHMYNIGLIKESRSSNFDTSDIRESSVQFDLERPLLEVVVKDLDEIWGKVELVDESVVPHVIENLLDIEEDSDRWKMLIEAVDYEVGRSQKLMTSGCFGMKPVLKWRDDVVGYCVLFNS